MRVTVFLAGISNGSRDDRVARERSTVSLVLVDRYPKIYSCMMTSESNCGLLARKDKHNGLVCYGVLPT